MNLEPQQRFSRRRAAIVVVAGLTVAGAVFADTLCASTSVERDHQPAGHETPCACAAGCGIQCCAQVLAVPPGSGFAPVLRAATDFRPVLAVEAAIATVANGLPSARAPPST